MLSWAVFLLGLRPVLARNHGCCTLHWDKNLLGLRSTIAPNHGCYCNALGLSFCGNFAPSLPVTMAATAIHDILFCSWRILPVTLVHLAKAYKTNLLRVKDNWAIPHCIVDWGKRNEYVPVGGIARYRQTGFCHSHNLWCLSLFPCVYIFKRRKVW